MEKKAYAIWKGPIQKGHGWISTESEVLQAAPYSFASRFENQVGTSSEEMIAAAHAGCFAMALSAALTKAGFEVISISASDSIKMDLVDEKWTITDSKLHVEADVKDIDENRFSEIAEEAKNDCPISRLLNAKIQLTSHLKTSAKSAEIRH
jgi:lipoyl-dependent peroxiredoxin